MSPKKRQIASRKVGPYFDLFEVADGPLKEKLSIEKWDLLSKTEQSIGSCLQPTNPAGSSVSAKAKWIVGPLVALRPEAAQQSVKSKFTLMVHCIDSNGAPLASIWSAWGSLRMLRKAGLMSSVDPLTFLAGFFAKCVVPLQVEKVNDEIVNKDEVVTNLRDQLYSRTIRSILREIASGYQR